MNLLADMLDGSSLIDEAATSGANALTLSWIAENGEEAWYQVTGALPGISFGSVPPLSSILEELTSHPMADHLSSGYLPLIRADYWDSNIAAPPGAPTAINPDDWIEFIPGSSGVYGVLVPEYVDTSFQLGLFSGTERLRLSVIVDLSRRLRVRRVSVTASEDGCGMSDDGDCQSDGHCSGTCEKEEFMGRLRPAVRCSCHRPRPGAQFVTFASSDDTSSTAYTADGTFAGSI